MEGASSIDWEREDDRVKKGGRDILIPKGVLGWGSERSYSSHDPLGPVGGATSRRAGH